MINVAKFGQKNWLCYINLSDCWTENDVPVRFRCNRIVRKSGVIIYTVIFLWLCVKIGILSGPPRGSHSSPKQAKPDNDQEHPEGQ